MHISFKAWDLYLLVLIVATLVVGTFKHSPWSAPPYDPELPTLRESLAAVETRPQRTQVLGYDRDVFGGWGTVQGCSTREWIISHQAGLTPCTHEAAEVFDPYTGATVAVTDVEIDHVFPLAAAWDSGAHAWDSATRVAFANDPRNLVAVSSRSNRAKSDQLPSEWLPPRRGSRCWYSRRVAEISATYQLTLADADVATIRWQCRFEIFRRRAAPAP